MGLITFGTNVMVHELGFADCPKSYVFRGAKEYAAVKVGFECSFTITFLSVCPRPHSPDASRRFSLGDVLACTAKARRSPSWSSPLVY